MPPETYLKCLRNMLRLVATHLNIPSLPEPCRGWSLDDFAEDAHDVRALLKETHAILEMVTEGPLDAVKLVEAGQRAAKLHELADRLIPSTPTGDPS